MRISSASSIEFPSEPIQGFDSPLATMRSELKRFYQKVDRHFTAIAYAEAGNLDMVQEMRDQDKAMKKQ